MSEQTKKNEWAEREVGALWKKQSPNQKYLSGHIKVDDGMGGEEILQVVIFNNKHKKKDTHPDFRIYKSLPRTVRDDQVRVGNKVNFEKTSEQTPDTEEDAALTSGVQEVSEEDVL